MIKIESPNTYEIERRYILSVMFGEFLGLDIQVQLSERQDTRIFIDSDHRELLIADKLFATSPNQWLQPASLPKQPLPSWNLATTSLSVITVSPEIPVIYGNDPKTPDFFQCLENKIYLGLDIFGSAFFMITRYEEVVKQERDQHDRFPATASLAYQEKFLDRPIINEYLEIIWSCLKHLYPRLKRKPRQFQTYLSHDVDEPFQYAFTGIGRLMRQCGRDILKRRTPLKVAKNFTGWYQVKNGYIETDPYNTFDRIMDISEKHNLKSAFYFITDHSSQKMDGVYSLYHPLIRKLLQRIYQRGHEIGLHASYNTYQDTTQTKKEFEILKQVCLEENIIQSYWGGRQHYLRWQTSQTFQNLENAGLQYDSTLTFADRPGFRCGICYEFPAFNIKTRQMLNLKERPLIIMECTIIEKRYMNFGIHPNIISYILRYRDHCQLFKGSFTLLWHNNSLSPQNALSLYEHLISEIKNSK